MSIVLSSCSLVIDSFVHRLSRFAFSAQIGTQLVLIEIVCSIMLGMHTFPFDLESQSYNKLYYISQ